ncbi:MAG: RnfABCDGE type electron transport complex subunit D [Eubacteriales bacterium]|nr:RnfABCDGE type electron transport complex subunit D [Eubacteriales bacterium]
MADNKKTAVNKRLLHVSASPHVRAKADSVYLMRMVVFALLPAAIFGVVNFGPRALVILLLSVASCCGFEALTNRWFKRPPSLRDYSAVVTGLLLGMNLPASVPFWMPVLGGAFAMIIVKALFGGLGENIMNPALGARCFLLISFAGSMCNFDVPKMAFLRTADTVSGATPLAAVKAGEQIDLLASFIGNTKGTIGETSALLLLLGGLFLLVYKIIDWHIPVTYLAAFSVFVLIFGGHGFDLYYLACELCSGGLMLGAWFMATDYVTSPITPTGRVVYGIFLGILTGIFRLFGASAEGVSYAIIFGNLLVPLIERMTIRKAFGRGGRA